LGLYPEDFKLDKFHAQLKMLADKPEGKPTCVKDIAAQLRKNSSTVRLLLNEVERLVVLLLTIPASAATAE